jgi:hypothetical protein
MAKYGGDADSSGMNQHRKMAGAGMKTDFDVSEYPARSAPHPDLKMKHMPMDDSARMPAATGKGRMMQGAPDHGPMGRDHFQRGGKV